MLFDSKRSKFESVVRAYSAELYRYAYWLCRDRFVAEDLVQDTFTRAWQAWDGLRDDKAAKSWLYTILRNEHARLFERKRLEIDDQQELDDLVDGGSLNAFENFEMREAMEALPKSYREPLLLQVLGGYSCSEIAGMINISEGAVMTRLTRARLALRRLTGNATERKVKVR
ncbi:MAG: sigma-70 family RNA polymerase sigma factor [Betaproteobacteria bacterium]|nr:sigma-70 family RNA polymerase sigma factor [Betaproteobacteria bacterium]